MGYFLQDNILDNDYEIGSFTFNNNQLHLSFYNIYGNIIKTGLMVLHMTTLHVHQT